MSTDVVSASEPRGPPVTAAPGPSRDSPPDAPSIGPHPIPDTAKLPAHGQDEIECAKPAAPIFLHSPPDSNNATKSDASDSELSELEEEPTLDDAPSATAFTTAPAPTSAPALEPAPSKLIGDEEDIGEVLPEEWSGAVPIFRPTWDQFKDFKKFSGIIKIIPPREWKDAQPPLDELVKQIRVREPIKQDIMGSNGTYRQVNILHGRSYNVPQWRQLCEQSEHQPPARRGERRANADKYKQVRPRPSNASKTNTPTTPKRRGRGRPSKNKGKKTIDENEERPMTPVSPGPEMEAGAEDKPVESIEQEVGDETKETDDESTVGRTGGRMGAVKPSKPKTQSVSARRKYSRREGSAMIDEAAFRGFDYRLDVSEFTPERCEELERAYWKTLTYAAPLYGADMMGTLFDDRTENWNLNKLPNLLDVLGTKIPGVNTAYLYLGMWKATFAWHLEDVDLYSINYLHFGAPKQWYSISQADARRFEAAMKSVWPADAKACSQFLRHKGFLISPQYLLQHYGIRVNKVVSYPGEFVVTYPYGYHSGYNLGYNCAEAVNFALDTWLEMGKIAKRCECAQAQDSVWINVHEIERKLRGEETEYEETEDEDDEDEDDEEQSSLPTPPASSSVKLKDASRKRRRGVDEKGAKTRVKKLKLRLKTKAEPPCCLCPNDVSIFELLPTEDGRKAHKLCALYLPETYIDVVEGQEIICNAGGVHKDRLNLKCLFCRSRRGACFQCSHKKCARGYHATCAAAAGVFVEDQHVPVFDENGIEYKEQVFEFNCRFHRVRRDKRVEGESLETDGTIRNAAQKLKVGDICQMQYLKGDIFAGIVVENREVDETLLLEILPNGDRLEVAWKWLLLPDPLDYRLPKASDNALPMPATRKAKDQLNATRPHEDRPRKDDVFAEGYTWAEFEVHEVHNKDQCKVSFEKPDQMWHYLGKTSTEAKAQYTENPDLQRHNPRGNFLNTVPKPSKPPKPPKPCKPAKPPKPALVSQPGYNHASYVAKAMAYSYNLAANHAANHAANYAAATTTPRPVTDPSRYRTPYSPHGGFLNGYEGDLRAHLMANQNELTRPFSTWGLSSWSAAPGITQQALPFQATKPRPAPIVKKFKVRLAAPFEFLLRSIVTVFVQIPSKVSPVPLPPHVVAAMTKASPPASGSESTSGETGATSPRSTAAPVISPQAANGPDAARTSDATARSFNATWQGGPAQDKVDLGITSAETMFTMERPKATQEFADVPGSESMQFVERMMQNLKKVSMNDTERKDG
ncbi:hypothetical protein UVI_02024130 [Ustilaginoidea virens]|uniref:[histone H3]-trimethyl-L-lysine(9) demethylase n=1 Tax=Ustilaginoidea virens TaxID=1159556 RepID=A0A1B5L1U4_USTVR|nr:hypothetical protein UVI_02024130 [Ustilaginoidea virens]